MDAIITSPNDRAEIPVIAPRGELAARQLAMPAHSNPAGDIFGGWIMAEMDAAAGMTTTRPHCHGRRLQHSVHAAGQDRGYRLLLYLREADRAHFDHAGCGSLGAPAWMRRSHQGDTGRVHLRRYRCRWSASPNYT